MPNDARRCGSSHGSATASTGDAGVGVRGAMPATQATQWGHLDHSFVDSLTHCCLMPVVARSLRISVTRVAVDVPETVGQGHKSSVNVLLFE